jgi:L-amino acid N-acyltransferase YncA
LDPDAPRPFANEPLAMVGFQQAAHSSSAPNERPNKTELLRLRDGSFVTIRPAAARDEPALRSFLSGLSLTARQWRFFGAGTDLASAARQMATSGSDRYGLVAHDEQGVIVGHALYVQLDETRAEVAVEVADYLHGRGLGTILIERLAAVAERQGIARFIAQVLPENREMLDVFRDGFDAAIAFHEGTETIGFPTSSWRVARERFAAQEARSAI